MSIKMLPQVLLEFEVLGVDLLAEREQRRRQGPHGRDVAGLRGVERRARGVDQVVDRVIDHATHDFVDQASLLQLRVLLAHRLVLAADHFQLTQLVDRDQAGADAVVDVVIVVGDGIGEVRELRLERRLASLQESLADVAQLARVGRRAVLEDAFANLEGQVQAGKLGIALFQFVDHAQRLQVVLEATEFAHAFVQRVLAGVSEGRVAEVVGQADRFDERLVQAQRLRDAARDLRHFERMREARAVQVAFVVDEDLGLVDEPTKRRRMHDAVAVALEFGAVTRWRFGHAPAPRRRIALSVRREPGFARPTLSFMPRPRNARARFRCSASGG